MIRIVHGIDFLPLCPRDQTPMAVGQLKLVGANSLVEAHCPLCAGQYLADLPVSFAIHSPTVLDTVTGEVFGDNISVWYHDRLRLAWAERPGSAVVPVARVHQPRRRIVILNCLDNLYGHVLLKLLNAQRHLRDPDIGLCVLLPAQMAHLVPPGASEIWEMNEPMRDGARWHQGLADWVSQRIASYDEVFLSEAYSHPRPTDYDLNYLHLQLPAVEGELTGVEPVVLFSYREDRPWGRNLPEQGQLLQDLYNRLSALFPRLGFVLVGFGKSFHIQQGTGKIIDARAERFDLETDRRWLALMSRSDCCVGVHGSNMLLPSGLARSTVILVPRSRYGNSVQDMLFARRSHDPRVAGLTHRMLYGNEELSDLSAERVTELVATQVAFTPVNDFFFNPDRFENPSAHFVEMCQRPVHRCAVESLKPAPPAQPGVAIRAIRKAKRIYRRYLGG